MRSGSLNLDHNNDNIDADQEEEEMKASPREDQRDENLLDIGA